MVIIFVTKSTPSTIINSIAKFTIRLFESWNGITD